MPGFCSSPAAFGPDSTGVMEYWTGHSLHGGDSCQLSDVASGKKISLAELRKNVILCTATVGNLKKRVSLTELKKVSFSARLRSEIWLLSIVRRRFCKQVSLAELRKSGKRCHSLHGCGRKSDSCQLSDAASVKKYHYLH